MEEFFRKLSTLVSRIVGSPAAFITSFLVVLLWATTGPLFNFSNTWQLVINTGTTIVTFLMVFLIQNTQNRDARAMHLKLDELINAVQGARTKMLDIEELSDDELEKIHQEFRDIHEKYSQALTERKGKFKLTEKLEITGSQPKKKSQT